MDTSDLEERLPRPAKEEVLSKTDVGQRVRALRHARDLSQGQLAAILGIPPTNVSAIERGVRGLSIQQLAKLASALSVSPAEILVSADPKPSRAPKLSRRFEQIQSLPRTKRRMLYEMIDVFLDRHGRSERP